MLKLVDKNLFPCAEGCLAGIVTYSVESNCLQFEDETGKLPCSVCIFNISKLF